MSMNLIMLIFGSIICILGWISNNYTLLIMSNVWVVGSIIVGEILLLRKD
jgi:hypothetical protein